MSKSKCESRSAGRHKRGGAPVPVTLDRVACKGRPDGKGGFFITLPHGVIDRLNYLREPGMSYSDVIMALTKSE